MDLGNFQKILRRDLGLVREKPILAGVSGGADSLCLAEALIQSGFNMIIAHFDHQLRATSSHDARLVEEFAKSRKSPFVTASQNVREYCQEHAFSIEEGARELRYRFLFDQAQKSVAQAVATGHTADDQAETVLMHFLRGSGVSGLKGMKPFTILGQLDAEIPLVRPLLSTTRLETEEFCRQNGIVFVQDETNSDPTYYRNRLRLELLPLLETYQPGIRGRLGKTSSLMAEVEELIAGLVDEALDRSTITTGPGHHILALDPLLREKIAIQRELLRKVIHDLREDARDVDFAAIERIIALIHDSEGGKRVEIMDGLEAICYPGKLIIQDRMVQIIQSDQLWMPPGITTIEQPDNTNIHLGNFEIEFHQQMIDQVSVKNLDYSDPLKAILDLDTLHFPLILRTREDGDRVFPFGMGGHSMKLSDYWVNEELPRGARAGWPLLCDQAGICWIPGYRSMHPYRVTDNTKNILEISVRRD